MHVVQGMVMKEFASYHEKVTHLFFKKKFSSSFLHCVVQFAGPIFGFFVNRYEDTEGPFRVGRCVVCVCVCGAACDWRVPWSVKCVCMT